MDLSQLQSLSNLLEEGDLGDDVQDDLTDNLNPSSFGSAKNSGALKSNDKAGEQPLFETVIKGGSNVRNKKDPKAIWDDDEVDGVLVVDEDEDRSSPEFEIMYQQDLNSQDAYLNMGVVDASTQSCGAILIKVELPNERFGDVHLDVTRNRMLVRSPKFCLLLDLPHQVKEDKGKAQWDEKKEILRVTLPIIREENF